MNSQVWWFVARSSGIVAWALLSLGVCWGLWLSAQTAGGRRRRATGRSRSRIGPTPGWMLALHRHLGGLAVIFTAIHIAGLVADSYVHFGWAEILVPMASEWEPGAVAFGIVAFYLLLAVEGTSLAMRYLPRPVWRWIHRSSYVLYATATYHGIAAGTDADNRWFRLAAWGSVAVVVTLTARLVIELHRVRAAERTTSTSRSVREATGSPTSSPAAWPPPSAPSAPVPLPPPVRPGRRVGSPRPPLVPSGVPATEPLVEVPSPADFGDEDRTVSAAGAVVDGRGHRPGAT